MADSPRLRRVLTIARATLARRRRAHNEARYQRYLDSCARSCRCCQECFGGACDGVFSADGWCERRECRCGWDEDDWEDDGQ